MSIRTASNQLAITSLSDLFALTEPGGAPLAPAGLPGGPAGPRCLRWQGRRQACATNAWGCAPPRRKWLGRGYQLYPRTRGRDPSPPSLDPAACAVQDCMALPSSAAKVIWSCGLLVDAASFSGARRAEHSILVPPWSKRPLLSLPPHYHPATARERRGCVERIEG